MFYRGYYIWQNAQQTAWYVQAGYEILKSCKTCGACKSWVTKLLNKKD